MLSCGANGGCENWFLQTVPKVAKYSAKKKNNNKYIFLEKKVLSTIKYNKVP